MLLRHPTGFLNTELLCPRSPTRGTLRLLQATYAPGRGVARRRRACRPTHCRDPGGVARPDLGRRHLGDPVRLLAGPARLTAPGLRGPPPTPCPTRHGRRRLLERAYSSSTVRSAGLPLPWSRCTWICPLAPWTWRWITRPPADADPTEITTATATMATSAATRPIPRLPRRRAHELCPDSSSRPPWRSHRSSAARLIAAWPPSFRSFASSTTRTCIGECP